MGIPRLKREIHQRIRSHKEGQSVAAIDDVMARQAFGEKNPTGKTESGLDLRTRSRRVVGVVGHVRQWETERATIEAQVHARSSTIRLRRCPMG